MGRAPAGATGHTVSPTRTASGSRRRRGLDIRQLLSGWFGRHGRFTVRLGTSGFRHSESACAQGAGEERANVGGGAEPDEPEVGPGGIGHGRLVAGPVLRML